MNAKAFVIAACSTSKSVGKWKRDTVMIPTYSGADLLTKSANWYNAIRIFLQRFIAGDTLEKCVEAANKTWPAEGKDADDRFVIRSGNVKMTLKT